MSSTRVFLVASSLARLIEKERAGHHVRQGYFPDQPRRSLSVRVEGETSSLILITKGPNGPVEETSAIPPSQAEALLDLATGRFEYLSIGLTTGIQPATLHRFITPGSLDLITVEFEQTNQARTFHPLPWFGPEVSHDPAYQARSIALVGLPSGTEVEITDAALESLLDTLDDGSEARLPEPSSQAVAAPELASDTEPADDDDDLEVEDSIIRELARSLRLQRRS
jgi:CYTH domain-containing protein